MDCKCGKKMSQVEDEVRLCDLPVYMHKYTCTCGLIFVATRVADLDNSKGWMRKTE